MSHHAYSHNSRGNASHGEASSTAPLSAEMQSKTNIFVRNIERSVDDNMLLKLFAPFGSVVSSALMRNIHTGESLGTGFVRYAKQDEAQAAMDTLNSFSINGRALILQWAKKQHDSTPAGVERHKLLKLFVRNVPVSITQEDMTGLFSQFGPLSNITLHKDTNPHSDNGFNGCDERRIAFVIYSKEGCAACAADAVHNTRPFDVCNNVPLMVKLADDNHPRMNHRSGEAPKSPYSDRSAATPTMQQTHRHGPLNANMMRQSSEKCFLHVPQNSKTFSHPVTPLLSAQTVVCSPNPQPVVVSAPLPYQQSFTSASRCGISAPVQMSRSAHFSITVPPLTTFAGCDAQASSACSSAPTSPGASLEMVTPNIYSGMYGGYNGMQSNVYSNQYDEVSGNDGSLSMSFSVPVGTPAELQRSSGNSSTYDLPQYRDAMPSTSKAAKSPTCYVNNPYGMTSTRRMVAATL